MQSKDRSISFYLALAHSARSLRKYKPKNQSIKLHAKRTQQKKAKNEERTKKHRTHSQPVRQPSSQQRLNRKEEINLCYTSISCETICTKNWFRSFFVVFSVDVFSLSRSARSLFAFLSYVLFFVLHFCVFLLGIFIVSVIDDVDSHFPYCGFFWPCSY